MLGQRRVQRAGAVEIAAERFFDDDPRRRRRDPVAVQPLGQIAEERWRDGKVERLHHVLADQFRKLLPAIRALCIDADIMQMPDEPRHALRVAGLGRHEFRDRLGDRRAEAGIVHLGPRRTDDARAFRDLPCRVAAIEAGQDLAPREIAGSAEDDKVEGIDGNHARNHVHLASAAHVSANGVAHSQFPSASLASRGRGGQRIASGTRPPHAFTSTTTRPRTCPFRIAAPRRGRSASAAGSTIASSLSIGRSRAIRLQARRRLS